MPKRLYRSGKDLVLAGVCGGLADYFDIDPLLIRIIFIILALAGGLGILIYLAAWLIIPRRSAGQGETPANTEERSPAMKRDPSGAVFGILVIILGIGLLLNNYGLFHFKFSLIWPLILIAIGVRLLIRDKK